MSSSIFCLKITLEKWTKKSDFEKMTRNSKKLKIDIFGRKSGHGQKIRYFDFELNSDAYENIKNA